MEILLLGRLNLTPLALVAAGVTVAIFLAVNGYKNQQKKKKEKL